jgi:hypothetical protein
MAQRTAIDNASELNEDAITCSLDDAIMMQGDGRIEQIAAKRTQPCEWHV